MRRKCCSSIHGRKRRSALPRLSSRQSVRKRGQGTGAISARDLVTWSHTERASAAQLSEQTALSLLSRAHFWHCSRVLRVLLFTSPTAGSSLERRQPCLLCGCRSLRATARWGTGAAGLRKSFRRSGD
eukprot:482370-Rhodomonas_salina.1